MNAERHIRTIRELFNWAEENDALDLPVWHPWRENLFASIKEARIIYSIDKKCAERYVLLE